MSKLVLIVFFVVVVFASVGWGVEDPELQQCKIQCGKQRQYDKEQIQDCEDKCDRYHEEKQRREKEEKEEEKGRLIEISNPEDPYRRLGECQGRCVQYQDKRQQRECQKVCFEQFQKARERQEREGQHGGGVMHLSTEEEDPSKWRRECERKCVQQHDERKKSECHQQCQERFKKREEEEEEEGEGEPYVFHNQHFSTQLRSDHGKIRILQKFTERSELLRGIENFRVAIFEANPQTFIVPHHWDADTVVFVRQGRGTLTLVHQDKRESINIRPGDVLRVQAGTTVYIVNSDKNDILRMVKLVHPVATPGRFEAFFGPGGENPESFFRAFSTELLEAAFNAKRDRIERVFSQQKQGPIIKASEEQIRSMSHHEEGSRGSFNLFEKHPSYLNDHGNYREVDPNEFSDLLELDVGVSFVNVSKGSMTAPVINTRATKIAIIVNGEGYLEIACPHLSSSEKGNGSSVSSSLRYGTVFVVPAGHPFITVASRKSSLHMVCFEVKALHNEKFQVAGRHNIFRFFERQATELAFGVPKEVVDTLIRCQDDDFFLQGPCAYT